MRVWGTRRTQCGKSIMMRDGAEGNISEAIVMIGLYDKNSDKLHAAIHAQLVLESTYEQRHKERNEG